MKVLAALILLILLIPATHAQEQDISPARQKIAVAKKAIQETPGRYQAYNELAMAFIHRAREVADSAYYKEAEEALESSIRLAPDNWDARKIRVAMLLGEHRFTDALDRAKKMNQEVPDDIQVYGYVTEANMAVGHYEDALDAAQWMLNMRPGNIPGLLCGASLRELYGDFDGAIEFLNSAYQNTALNEVEERAWMLIRLADLALKTGNASGAAHFVHQASDLFPNYPQALPTQARVETAQGKYSEAVGTLAALTHSSPIPHNLYLLAEALERAGQLDAAQSVYADFEQKAIHSESSENANDDLAFYYAGPAHKPAEALAVARKEVSRRRDAKTVDAYAWALHVNGDDAEAERQENSLLSAGVADPQILYHSGMIAVRLNHMVNADRYLHKALDLKPSANIARLVQEALSGIAKTSAAASLPGTGLRP